MSFMRRYWQGELVQLHSWTRELTFQKPFRLQGFAQLFPPGHYTVELAEVEVAVRDRTVKQMLHCMVPIPPSMLPPGVRTMFRNVDYSELERRHAEDTRHGLRRSARNYRPSPPDHRHLGYQSSDAGEDRPSAQ